jgi:hypothetical protein
MQKPPLIRGELKKIRVRGYIGNGAYRKYGMEEINGKGLAQMAFPKKFSLSWFAPGTVYSFRTRLV